MGLVMALGVVVLVGWCVSGCQAGIGDPCETDADCANEEICAQNQCTRRCQSDEDCPESRGFSCQPYLPEDEEEPINVCLDEPQPDAGDTSDEGSCTSDRECERRLDTGRARCGLDGECLLAPLRFGARLVDTTGEPLPQDGAPGADIGAVLIAEPGSTGDQLQASEIVAAGRTVAYEPAGDGGESRLDGGVPELGRDGRCTTAESAGEFTALGGNGGSVVVEFQTPDGGTEIEGFGQLDVVVIEWDENCGATVEGSDQFEMELCVTNRSTWNPAEDCGLEVGDGGYSGFVRVGIPEGVGE